MSDWRALLSKTTANVEERFDQLKAQLSQRLGINEPLLIQPYFGYGTEQSVTIKGRVLENEGVRPSNDKDSIWRNMLNMYRQLESDEIPNATVQGQFQGQKATAVTDEEGYFDLHFHFSKPLTVDSLWHPVNLSLLDAPYPLEKPVTAVGEVLVVPKTAAFGIISDIDDTILKSQATSYLRAARLLFLKNARTRLPFQGVAAFYRALHQGTNKQNNPIFYVSSSPWNVYKLLADFFKYQEIPQGPLFLKDYGITSEQFFSSGHRKHKLQQIETIFQNFPQLPFVLIGDSGQKDPEIYAEIAEKYPSRIKAIFIRDVSKNRRDVEVEAIADEMSELDIAMMLTPDSLTAAAYAAQQGLIEHDALKHIALNQDDEEFSQTDTPLTL